MSLTNPNTPVSQQDLQDFYHKLVPYLGGSFGMIANKFSKGDMYSTDEKMIGQWIDGKPLYQRVFDYGALPNKSTKDVLHNISDIDVVVFAIGIAYGANTNFYPIPYTSPDSLGDNILMTVSTTYVRIMTGYNRSNLTNCYIVLQYTKTTDSAIAIGDETDYSTEEKIVGTWIDGKPVWQKTFTGTTGTGDYTFAHNISNMKFVVGVTGYARASDTVAVPFGYNDGSNRFSAYVSTTDVVIRQSGYNNKSFSVTLQYTKTTD